MIVKKGLMFNGETMFVYLFILLMMMMIPNGQGGFVVSIIGSILFVFGNVVSFAFLYVLGIVISLAGTGFLIGVRPFR